MANCYFSATAMAGRLYVQGIPADIVPVGAGVSQPTEAGRGKRTGSWSSPDDGAVMMNVSALSGRHCCAVVELRQYTLKPGHRDTLIALFDRYFVESQEAAGMTVVGQFLDWRRSDRFVWIRGFSDMKSRHAALEQFYNGPLWAAHKAVANDTMLDSNDVLLLRPARPDVAFRLNPRDRPALGEERTAAVVLAGIHQLRQLADPAIVSLFERQVIPVLHANGVHTLWRAWHSAASCYTSSPVPLRRSSPPTEHTRHCTGARSWPFAP